MASARLNSGLPRALLVEVARLLGVPSGDVGKVVQERLTLYKLPVIKSILRVSKNMLPGSRVRISGNKRELVRRVQALFLADRTGAVVDPTVARTNIALRELGNVAAQQRVVPQPSTLPPPKPPFDVLAVLNSPMYLNTIDPRLTRASMLAYSYGRSSMAMRVEFTLGTADWDRVSAGTHSVVLTLYDGARLAACPWDGLRLAVNYVPIFPPQRRHKRGRKYIVPAPHVPPTALRKEGKNSVTVSGWMGRNLLLVVEFVQVSTIDQLLTRVPVGAEPQAAAESDDLIVADTVVSTKCPLSMVRMGQPAKGKMCTHHQCFDLRNYVEFCCRNGTWHCIVCDNPLPFRNLIVCPFFTRVLQNTPADTSRVLIRHDLTFSAAPEESPRTPRTRKVQPETTPPPSSAAASGGSSGGGGGGGGASNTPAEGAGEAALVILSDSDDDEPATPAASSASGAATGTTNTPNGAAAAPAAPVVAKLEAGAAAPAPEPAPAPAEAAAPAPIDEGAIYIDSEDDGEEYRGPPPRQQAVASPYDPGMRGEALYSLLRSLPGERRWCNNCMTYH